MSIMARENKLALLRTLCQTFGPSGCEDRVAQVIKDNISGLYDELVPDRMGGVIAVIRSRRKSSSNAKIAPKRLMLSCHMDEVGFMIREITDEGYLKIASMCGRDTRIMASRKVTVCNEHGEPVRGVFALRPIHLVKREDDDKALDIDELYIDIGARDKAEAQRHVNIGDFATFESDFVVFGENDGKIKAKALDDRIGCMILCDVMEQVWEKRDSLPFDVFFAFTCREELGISGAGTAAHLIDPDFAIVFEATAVADLDGVPDSGRVAAQGNGPAISLMDRSTVYDREFTNYIIDTCKKEEIPYQIKQLVSGGNDAGHIHKSRAGVRCAAVSAPARYIHTPSSVVDVEDIDNMERLCKAVIERLSSDLGGDSKNA